MPTWEAGASVDATAACRAALELARARTERGHEAWALRLQAEIQLRAVDDAEGAIGSYALARDMSQDLDMKPLAALALLGRSRALLRLGRAAESQRDLDSAHRLLAEMKMRLPKHMAGDV